MKYVICFFVGALFILADVHSQILLNTALHGTQGYWKVATLSFIGCGIALIASIAHNKSFGLHDFVDMIFIMLIIAVFDKGIEKVVESVLELTVSIFGQLVWLVVLIAGLVLVIKPILETWKRALSLCATLILLFSALVIISSYSDISHDVYFYTAAFMMAAVKIDINAKRRRRHS